MKRSELGARFPVSTLWSVDAAMARLAQQERRNAPNGAMICPRCGGLGMREIAHCRQDGWGGPCREGEEA